MLQPQSNTFLTQEKQQSPSKQKVPRKTQASPIVSARKETELSPMFSHTSEQAVTPNPNLQLEDPYVDDDFTIYFTKQSLLSHIIELEEELVFMIDQVEKDFTSLESFKAKQRQFIQKKMEPLNELEADIAVKRSELDDAQAKNAYFKVSGNKDNSQ